MNLDSFPRPDCSDLIVRKGTNCEKWDRLDQVCGRMICCQCGWLIWICRCRLVVKAIKLRAGHPAYGYTFRLTILSGVYRLGLERHGWQINFEWLSDAPGLSRFGSVY